MENLETQKLYQAVILEHNKKPKNFGILENPTHSAEGFNPLCGDHYWVYLVVDSNQVIQEVRFQGSGCAISKASASIMTENLRGKKIAEVQIQIGDFLHFLKGEKSEDSKQSVAPITGKLKIFSGISQYPSRIKCASLAWYALRDALKEKEA